MKVFIVINDERHTTAEIDDRIIDCFAGDDKVKQAKFISEEIVPNILAMLMLEEVKPK